MWGAIAALSGYGMLAYLHETPDLFTMIGNHVNAWTPEKQSPMDRLIFPLQWLQTLWGTHLRFLSPLWAAFAFYELLSGGARGFFRRRPNPLETAVILTFGAMLITSLAGPRFVMIHSFWFLLGLPAFALLCASFIEGLGKRELRWRTWWIGLGLAIAFYPYGIYRSSAVLELISDVGFLVVSIAFYHFARRDPGERSTKWVFTLMLLSAGLNFSQTVNHRREDDTEYAFCKTMLMRYLETRAPVKTDAYPTPSRKDLYCRGIPIIWP